jgi:hypothetical protein
MQTDERSRRDSQALRELGRALGLACVGLVGALPLASGPAGRASDPLLLLAWLALCAAPCGAALVALGLRPWPYGAAVVGAWGTLVVIVAGTSVREVPTPLWGVLALAGLTAGGAALAQFARAPAQVALALGALGLGLALLPVAPGIAGVPWPIAVASAALEASPVTLVAEASGLDWMRTAGVYDSAGTDRLERAPWRGELAGPVALVLGCAALGVAALVRRSPSPKGPAST